jgi:fluoride exporter
MDATALTRYALIAIGAALGANARYLVLLWAAGRFGPPAVLEPAFPYGTFLVNTSGSFVLGFLLAFTTGRLAVSPNTALFIGVGFLGSYTTFSTFAAENVLLLQGNAYWYSLANIIGQNLISLLSVALGLYLGRLLSAF